MIMPDELASDNASTVDCTAGVTWLIHASRARPSHHPLSRLSMMSVSVFVFIFADSRMSMVILVSLLLVWCGWNWLGLAKSVSDSGLVRFDLTSSGVVCSSLTSSVALLSIFWLEDTRVPRGSHQ